MRCEEGTCERIKYNKTLLVKVRSDKINRNQSVEDSRARGSART